MFTRVVNHWVIVLKDSGRQIRPAGTKGASPWSVVSAALDLETYYPSAWRKNHPLARRYADSGRPAYDALALENQVLLTIAG